MLLYYLTDKICLVERNNKEDLQAFLLDENLEKLENLTETFNIFSSLKSVYSESTHSNFLAWLLNPKETHGIGDYFLTRFLYHVTIQKSENTNQDISIFDVDQWELEDTRILREYKNMDIAIIDKKNSLRARARQAWSQQDIPTEEADHV